MKKLLFLGAIAFGAYWFVMRPGCGTGGAIACPEAALEEGVGETLQAAEVCLGAGYLCAGRSAFQVARWPLDQGRLRVRVRLPDFVDEASAGELRQAAIDGIMEWDGHPFPIVIDAGEFTLRFWDIGVVWSQGMYNDAGGLARIAVRPEGKRIAFAVDGLSVVVPRVAAGAERVLTDSSDPDAVMEQLKAMASGQEMGPAMLAQIKATAMHEMGHALGLMHSDSQGDIMFPRFERGVTQVRASARDLRTVDALYALPNGAMVE